MKPVRLQGSWSFSRYATPAVVMTSKGQDTSSNVSTARLRPCAFSRAIHYILQPPTTKMTSQSKCASTALLSQHPVQAGWVLFIQRLLSRLVSVERSDPKTRSVQEPPNTQGHHLQDGWNQSTAWESTAASVTHPGTCWVKWSDSWCWNSWNHTKMGHGVIKRGRS